MLQRPANTLQIDALLDRKPKELSGGQRQRVAIGRAIAPEPALFLFDEPLSNLDAKLRVDMRTQIKRLHMKFRTTSVYVTHDEVEAMTLADQIVILRNGGIEQVGTPSELYSTPKNMFVAGFIGSPLFRNSKRAEMTESRRPAVGFLRAGRGDHVSFGDVPHQVSAGPTRRRLIPPRPRNRFIVLPEPNRLQAPLSG